MDANSGARRRGFWKQPLKVITIIGAAFLAGVGGYLATRTIGAVERQFASAPLSVTRVHFGAAAHVYAPYYFMPDSFGLGPEEAPRDTAGKYWSHDIEKWMRSRGAIEGSPQIVSVELRGRTDDPVIVNGVRINVVRRGKPLTGWFFADGGCGAGYSRILGIDLDANPAKATFLQEGDVDPRPPGSLFLTVTRKDIEILELHASTTKSDVEWTAEILYSGPSGTGRVLVDDDGRPFRVTSEREGKGYWLEPEFQRMERRPDWDDGILMC